MNIQKLKLEPVWNTLSAKMPVASFPLAIDVLRALSENYRGRCCFSYIKRGVIHKRSDVTRVLYFGIKMFFFIFIQRLVS